MERAGTSGYALCTSTGAKFDSACLIPAAGTYQLETKIITSGICATPGANSYESCTFSFTWPAAFADNSYVPDCIGINPSLSNENGSAVNLAIANGGKSTTGLTLLISNGTSNGGYAATYGEIDCKGIHP